MAKDPAALLYIDKWFVATKEMKADCRGWYLNLILHQFDKGDLPNDVEELANLADVRISEYQQFQQVWEQVLKHKFQQNGNNRLANAFAKQILANREVYKEKRGHAGKISAFCKYVRKHLCQDENIIFLAKQNIDFDNVGELDANTIQHLFQQVLEQMPQQTPEQKVNYRNVNVNVNTSKEDIGGVGEKEETRTAANEVSKNVFLVPEMVAVFKEFQPRYHVQQSKDFPALLLLAQTIGEAEKVNYLTPAGFETVKRTWAAIAEFVAKDSFYGRFSLAQIEKHIQSIFLKMQEANSQTAQTSKQAVKTTTIQNNADAADAARQILANKYGANAAQA
ncbi:DUF1376 domain-containing protein [Foetidibacter luteolus]|uniref:DUF1376 domain-containing protein n=1 Tax=Foetidibacter luteolus TaxID=2608880 RepID=UPI00129B6AA8|nr:DUF1376 domain-containing protein [Foetidibacter luteolus]